MASIIETIKARIDIVEEIGLVVALQKSGKAQKGLCPFHNERTPSFYVFPESQTWHCFGCNEGAMSLALYRSSRAWNFVRRCNIWRRRRALRLRRVERELLRRSGSVARRRSSYAN